MRRRTFFAIGAAVLSSAACDLLQPVAPTRSENRSEEPRQTPSPRPVTISLLVSIQQAGYPSARAVSYGNNGAARIAINDHPNWNFFVDGQPIGIGSSGTPTLNVPDLQVANNARIMVRAA